MPSELRPPGTVVAPYFRSTGVSQTRYYIGGNYTAVLLGPTSNVGNVGYVHHLSASHNIFNPDHPDFVEVDDVCPVLIRKVLARRYNA